MDAQDRNKVKAAGFRIFRRRRVHPISGGGAVRSSIWELSETGNWCKLQDYPSQAAMDRAWKELMKDGKNIGDENPGEGGERRDQERTETTPGNP